MRRNTIISILMAGLLAVSAAGCRSVPSDSELEKALEEGTITFEDAKSRGWVDDAWLEEHFPPIEAGSKIHSFPPFETTYLGSTEKVIFDENLLNVFGKEIFRPCTLSQDTQRQKAGISEPVHV